METTTKGVLMTVRKEPVDLTLLDVLSAIDFTMEETYRKCHGVSLAVVQSGLVDGRVARGRCPGVASQHSWVVVGSNPYDPNALIVDATLWSYRTDFMGRLFVGTVKELGHQAHGYCGGQTIWDWGCPYLLPGEDPIGLTPSFEMSDEARGFLDSVGPLGRNGWAQLAANAPVNGWPAAEVTAAIDDTPAISTLVPIDRLGMLTNRNPGGLYFPYGVEMPDFTDTVTLGRSDDD